MKISEAAKFESDLLKSNEDIANPANHERNVRKIPRLCVAIIFALFGRIIFKLGSVDGYSAKENCFYA